MSTRDHFSILNARGGFTLSETMISVFILGIGLIMLATVFPVAGNWARQSSEETVAQAVGQTAVAYIQTRYTANDFTSVGTDVVVIPSLASKLHWRYRTYAFGNANPWPTPWKLPADVDPNVSNRIIPPNFSWTALVRRQPGQTPGTGVKLDVFILVSKKGESSQTFNSDTAAPGRAPTDPRTGITTGEFYLPRLAKDSVANLAPGTRGIGEKSGLVFRKLSATENSVSLLAGESAWYVPPPENADRTASPLIYIYVTSLNF